MTRNQEILARYLEGALSAVPDLPKGGGSDDFEANILGALSNPKDIAEVRKLILEWQDVANAYKEKIDLAKQSGNLNVFDANSGRADALKAVRVLQQHIQSLRK